MGVLGQIARRRELVEGALGLLGPPGHLPVLGTLLPGSIDHLQLLGWGTWNLDHLLPLEWRTGQLGHLQVLEVLLLRYTDHLQLLGEGSWNVGQLLPPEGRAGLLGHLLLLGALLLGHTDHLQLLNWRTRLLELGSRLREHLCKLQLLQWRTMHLDSIQMLVRQARLLWQPQVLGWGVGLWRQGGHPQSLEWGTLLLGHLQPPERSTVLF